MISSIPFLSDVISVVLATFVGLGIIFWSYLRPEVPSRCSRLVFGLILMLWGTASVAVIDFLLSKTIGATEANLANAIQSGVITLTSYMVMLKFFIQFSFTAVGAGLVSNSIVTPRDEICAKRCSPKGGESLGRS